MLFVLTFFDFVWSWEPDSHGPIRSRSHKFRHRKVTNSVVKKHVGIGIILVLAYCQIPNLRRVVLPVFGKSQCQGCMMWRQRKLRGKRAAWQSTIYTLHFTHYTLNFTLETLHFTLYTPHSSIYTPQSTLCTWHSTLYTLFSTLYTPNSLFCTLHPTLHHPLYTARSTLYTVHSTLSKHYTWHPALYTLYSTLYSAHSTLYSAHSTLYSLHSALRTLHCTLCTSFSALYTVHSRLYTLHSTLHTPPSPLHTLHTTVPIQHPAVFTVFTLHTLQSTPFPTSQSTLVREQGKHVQDCWKNLFHTRWLLLCVFFLGPVIMVCCGRLSWSFGGLHSRAILARRTREYSDTSYALPDFRHAACRCSAWWRAARWRQWRAARGDIFFDSRHVFVMSCHAELLSLWCNWDGLLHWSFCVEEVQQEQEETDYQTEVQEEVDYVDSDFSEGCAREPCWNLVICVWYRMPWNPVGRLNVVRTSKDDSIIFHT